MRRLIFPHFMLGHFLVGWKCTGCGQPAHGLTLRFPRVRLEEDKIVLIYPARCPCGERGCLTVVLPALFFGYVIGRLLVIDAAKSRSKAELLINAKPCALFESLCRECEKDIMQFAVEMTSDSSDPPANQQEEGGRSQEHERFIFRLTLEEWKAFMKRLGFDDGDGMSET